MSGLVRRAIDFNRTWRPGGRLKRTDVRQTSSMRCTDAFFRLLIDDQLALHFLMSHPAEDRTLEWESSGLIRHEFKGDSYTFR
jgi:hypothetical protein